jgi:hypothetical protein
VPDPTVALALPSGLRLYFFVLKFLAALFFCLGFITLPAVTSFAAGRMYEDSSAERFRSSMGGLTIGNVYANYSDIARAKSSALFVASETDALATLASVIAILWLGTAMKRIVRDTDRENASMRDYTVQISPVHRPRGEPASPRAAAAAAAAAAQRSHGSCDQRVAACLGGESIGWDEFRAKKQAAAEGGGGTAVWGGSTREEFHRMVQQALDHELKKAGVDSELLCGGGGGGGDQGDDSYVARKPYKRDQRTIWSAWDEEENIRLWERKLGLLYRLEEALARAPAHGGHDGGAGVGDRGRAGGGGQQQDLQEEVAAQGVFVGTVWSKVLEQALQELRGVNRQLHATQRRAMYKPVAVFVTFEHAEAMREATKLSWAEAGGDPEPGTILIGGWVCTIEEAPEPDAMQWGHLAYSARSRRLRLWGINIISAMLLLLAFYLLLIVKRHSQAMDYTLSCKYVMGSQMELRDDVQLLDGMSVPCPGLLGELGRPNWDNGTIVRDGIVRDGQSRARGGPSSDEDYSQLYRSAYTALAARTNFPRVDSGAEELLPYQRRCARWGDWRPSRQGTTASCHRVDGIGDMQMLYSGGDMDSMCYACVCSLPEFEDSLVAQYGEGYCQPLAEQADGTRLWKIVAVVWVVATNQLLKLGIRKTAPLLRSHTLEFQLMSQATRVFFCQLSNTALLNVLLKTSLGPFKSLPGQHYPTINAKWYADVAAPMVSTMCIQFIIPWGIHAVTWLLVAVERWVGSCCAHSQNAMNRAFTPGDFDIAGSYGEVLLAMWVTFMFGSGVPMLYWVASLGFSIRFCVDKVVVLRLYKRPPMYSSKLIERFDTLAILAVFVHAGVGCGMLAYAGGTNPTRLSKFLPVSPHMWPMLAALGVTACAVCRRVLKVLVFVSPAVEHRLHTPDKASVPLWLRCLVCQRGLRNASYTEKLRPFSEARELGEIVNTVYSYHAPKHAKLEDLQKEFCRKLQEDRDARKLPLLRHGRSGTRMNCMSSSSSNVYALLPSDGGIVPQEIDQQEATYQLLSKAVNGVY